MDCDVDMITTPRIIGRTETGCDRLQQQFGRPRLHHKSQQISQYLGAFTALGWATFFTDQFGPVWRGQNGSSNPKTARDYSLYNTNRLSDTGYS